MVLSRIIKPTTERLFAFAVGCHDLSLIRQRMKYQSGFRQFGKWSSCGETNLIQTGTLLSQMSLSPSPPPSLWSLSLSTVVNYRIAHREKQYCQSNTSRWLQKRCYCEINPFQGVENKNLEPVSEAIENMGKSQPAPVAGKRKYTQDSPSDSDQSDPKRARGAGPTLKSHGKQEPLGRDLAVDVGHEMKGDGEYVLSIKRVTPSSRREEDKVERAKQMAQKASVLLLYGEMLLQMGNKLRAHSQASLDSVFDLPAPSNTESDVE